MGVSQSVSRIKQKEVWIDYMRFYFMYRLNPASSCVAEYH